MLHSITMIDSRFACKAPLLPSARFHVETQLHGLLVNENQTGYAQRFQNEVKNPLAVPLDLRFSEITPVITSEWNGPDSAEHAKDRCSRRTTKADEQ
jgi:hypothetical protein